MKIITSTKTVVEGNKITITAELSEKEFQLPVQLTTIGHGVATNIHHPRHVQISNEALFVKRMHSQTKRGAAVAWLIDELVDIFVNIEPGLTDAPVFVQQPKPDLLDATVNSEIPFTLAWEQSDDCKTWLTTDKSIVVPGKFYRAIATNAAGSTISNAVKLK